MPLFELANSYENDALSKIYDCLNMNHQYYNDKLEEVKETLNKSGQK